MRNRAYTEAGYREKYAMVGIENSITGWIKIIPIKELCRRLELKMSCLEIVNY